MAKRNILIATGGTGGHIFPALALKNKLEEQGIKVKLTADAKFARYHLFDEDHLLIPAASFNSKSLLKILLTLLTLMCGLFKALYYIHREKPDMVVGFGGYATYPTMLAAILLRKEIILHEANTVIGKVNRLLLWRAKYLTTGFKNIQGVKPQYKHKIIYTGNHVRNDILTTTAIRDKNKIVILIIGGSQGAKIFSTIIPDMVVKLPIDIKDKLYIYQQAKEEDIISIQTKYAQEGIACEVKSFFTDMNNKFSKANLVIARSGASTIAELISLGLPAILIPLPTSADNHQYHNAKEIADENASWLVVEDKDTSSNLLRIVKSINEDHSILDIYSSNLYALQQDASKNIVDVINRS